MTLNVYNSFGIFIKVIIKLTCSLLMTGLTLCSKRTVEYSLNVISSELIKRFGLFVEEVIREMHTSGL